MSWVKINEGPYGLKPSGTNENKEVPVEVFVNTKTYEIKLFPRKKVQELGDAHFLTLLNKARKKPEEEVTDDDVEYL